MSQDFNQVVVTAVKSQEQATALVEKLFVVAQPGAVYSKPARANEYTIVTASEVSVAMGCGYGLGGGTAPERAGDESASETDPRGQMGEAGFGGGGGGGGAASGRPVAVISIGSRGVRVEPVVDVTKIALAFFTMLGSLLVILNKMRQASRG
jgi:uncharacterized spore protein YtfJ